jgi:hypothetical protein
MALENPQDWIENARDIYQQAIVAPGLKASRPIKLISGLAEVLALR